MTIYGNDNVSIKSRLTKGNVAPPPNNLPLKNKTGERDISALTGELRESKAKDYTTAQLKKVVNHYVGAISNLTGQLDENNKPILDVKSQPDINLKALVDLTINVTINKASNQYDQR